MYAIAGQKAHHRYFMMSGVGDRGFDIIGSGKTGRRKRIPLDLGCG
jgi:hypothetical protein